MATEQYSIGYEEGYQAGWNAAMESLPAPEQQEPVTKIISNLEPLLAAKNQSWAYAENMLLGLLTDVQQPAPEQQCARSHPHENMDAMCELRTEIARLTNENARLKAQPAQQQEPDAFDDDIEVIGHNEIRTRYRLEKGTKLYASPQPAQRTWVGLSPADRGKCLSAGDAHGWIGVMEATEARLKELNT